ncbi:MAG: hypothetical protein C5B55_06855 [Blastocatellia bacterium]|nr:MAG: hypothetical protein C5B55_06855 [Blastocatellia bacterium]
MGITTVVFAIGRLALVPWLVDTDGLTIGIAIDNKTYRGVQQELVYALSTSGWHGWLAQTAPLHTRLYSLSFALLGKVFGGSILAVEPLNLVYYLATLTIVYMLGREIFSAQAGMIAATITAILPSSLVLSTQLIRDPMSNMCLLALVLLLTALGARTLTWGHALLMMCATIVVVGALWLARGNIWSIVVISLLTALVLVVVRMIGQKRFLVVNAIAIVIVMSAALVIPRLLESTTLPDTKPPIAALSLQKANNDMGMFTRLLMQIAERRDGFLHSYSANTSTIDNVRLLGAGDIIRYLPRASEIGFLAPFPNMWLALGGEVGRTGRLASGCEMMLMYVIYVVAFVTLWTERRRLQMWFIFIVATSGMIGLGLIVANAGALYRLRYSFWMMLFVIASQGILAISKRLMPDKF